MNGFEIHQVVFGDLRAAKSTLEGIRCEVFLNRLNTTGLRAEVYDVSGSSAGRFLKDFMSREVVFEAIGPDGKIRFNGTVASGQVASGSDLIGTISIEHYEETWIVNHDPITQLSVVFYLTPSQIFRRRRLVTQHDFKGLLLGWRGGLDSSDETWDDDSVTYQSSMGDLVFYPGLVFADEPGGGVVVRDQLKVSAALNGERLDVSHQFNLISERLGRFLDVMSFLEQRRCDWFRAEIDARGQGGKGFVTSVYKRLPNYEYSDSQHIRTHVMDYVSLIPKVVEKIEILEGPLRTNIDKAIVQMLYGAGAKQSIENQLVYWHSCLDILLKTILSRDPASRKPEGFSRKLIVACESVGVQWNDLYPYLSREEVFSSGKKDFLITRYRNQIIHEGLYPESEEYGDLIAENARAKALVERLIMGLLGLYDKECPVGKYRDF